MLDLAMSAASTSCVCEVSAHIRSSAREVPHASHTIRNAKLNKSHRNGQFSIGCTHVQVISMLLSLTIHSQKTFGSHAFIRNFANTDSQWSIVTDLG